MTGRSSSQRQPSYERISVGNNRYSFICVPCGSRTMRYASYRRHTKLESHKRNLRVWLTDQAAQERQRAQLASMAPEEHIDLSSGDENTGNNMDLDLDEGDEDVVMVSLHDGDAHLHHSTNTPDYGHQVVDDMWTNDYSHLYKEPEGSERSSEHGEGSILDGRDEDEEATESDDIESVDTTLHSEPGGDEQMRFNNAWYPFRNKREVVGMLLLGTTRDLLSRDQYTRVVSLVRMLGVQLPEHSALCKRRKRLKEQLGFNIWEHVSPLGAPCFGLNLKDIISQELSNLHVSEHLRFYPEVNTTGPYNRLSQSQKWLSGFAVDRRVPMVQTPDGRHWFLYEPIQTIHSKTIYVPVFFYTLDDVLHAKCLVTSLTLLEDQQIVHITIPVEPNFNSSQLIEFPVLDFSKQLNDIEIRENVFLKDHCDSTMHQHTLNSDLMVEIPTVNPWRVKAKNKVIRHFPIMLYSDDSSGNVSNKWNKHMSFYLTAAGLPPRLSNQEYNIHFISTSNVAGALEMGIKIVDDLNTMGDHGFVCYDSQLKQDVVVIPVVLAYLGDSPMHAEISNTMLPSRALTPCRSCNLKVGKAIEKVTTQYVSQFVGVDDSGVESHLPKRCWTDTVQQTKDLWKLACESRNLADFDNQSRSLGVKDTLNGHFVEQVLKLRRDKDSTPADVQRLVLGLESEHGDNLFNPFLRLKGFDGHQDTPVEVLHVVLLGVAEYMISDAMRDIKDHQKQELWGRWSSFKCDGLNIPPIIPKTMIRHFGSLVGKEVKIFLQAAPFVLFPYLQPEKKDMWTALCHLSSRIFQTEILDMDVYLIDLKIWINIFLKETMKVTAQWTNKPKFHMLLHLAESIERLGPACLFATEGFESYNRPMRNQSIHSNRQSPGQDIANSFNNYKLVRTLVAGGRFFDRIIKTSMTAGPRVVALFSDPTVQKMLGFDSDWDQPHKLKFKKSQMAAVAAPPFLLDHSPGIQWTPVFGLSLTRHVNLYQDSFISVQGSQSGSSGFIGCVKEIWAPKGGEPKASKLLITRCCVTRLNVWYGLRTVIKTEQQTWIDLSDIEGVINVQHNCHDGQCGLRETRSQHQERREISTIGYAIVHSELNEFLINSGALHSPALHRRWARMNPNEVKPEDWVSSIAQGVTTWEGNLASRKGQRKPGDSTENPSTTAAKGKGRQT